jgi:hypothetical protein
MPLREWQEIQEVLWFSDDIALSKILNYIDRYTISAKPI